MLPPSTRCRRWPLPSTALTSPREEITRALASTAFGRAVAAMPADSAAQSLVHTRASKSVPRMPMVAVAVWIRAALGELLEMRPVTARKPPRTSCINMPLSAAFSLNRYCCRTSSELGRTVMRVPSSSLMMAEAPSDVVRRSPSFSVKPLPSVRGVCPAVCAKPTPRANSISPASCAPAPPAASNRQVPSRARARCGFRSCAATISAPPETIFSAEYPSLTPLYTVVPGTPIPARLTQRINVRISRSGPISGCGGKPRGDVALERRACAQGSGQPFGVGLALRRGPRRTGEMRVPGEARHDMPMQVGHGVAQGREVHLDRIEVLAQRFLDVRYGIDAQVPIGRREIGELGHMTRPDEPIERREPGFIGADHAELRPVEHDGAAGGVAEDAARHLHHTRTRSMPPALAACTYSGIQA